MMWYTHTAATSVLETVFLVPTAVGSYNDARAHTCKLTNPHPQEPFLVVINVKA